MPTQLGRHFWPNFSFIDGIRIDYLSPTIYLTDVLIVFLLIAWVTQLISNVKFQMSNFKLDIGTYLKLVVLASLLIVGILFSKSPLAGWYGFGKVCEYLFLGLYVKTQWQALNKTLVSFLLSLAILYSSCLSLLQFFHHGSAGGIWYFFGERSFNAQTPGIANASINGELVLRPYATFPHPNVLAGFLTIAMTMVISNIKKIFLSTAIIIGSACLFLTLSRVAILLWVCILGFYLAQYIFCKKRFRKRNSVIFACILLGTAFVFFATPLKDRFFETRLSDESIKSRTLLLHDSLLFLKQHPLFGVGINNFLINLSQIEKTQRIYYVQPVHNIFLLFVSQTGFAGLCFLLWFIANLIRHLKKHQERYSYKFVLIGEIAVLGFFDHYFLTIQQGQLLLGVVLGLAFANE